MVFWPYARAAMEFLQALGYEWKNDLGFDCHESYAVRWSVPEGMVGYLVWLARRGKTVPELWEHLRYRDVSRKLAGTVKALTSAVERHVNRLACSDRFRA